MAPPRPPRAALSFLLGAAAGALAAGAVRRARAPKAPPPPARVGTALDAVNDGFHEAYDEARGRAALDAPVFVVLADVLVLVRRGERHEFSFSPRLFHVIKSAAHAPVAAYAALHRRAGAPLGPRERLGALRAHVARALASLEAEADGGAALDNAGDVLAATLGFLDRALEHGRAAPAELDAFARLTGPALLRCTDDATRVQLDAINAHVARALATMTPDERRTFQVVVTGNHQARARSIGMQYFQRLLGEGPSEERRVAYAEGAASEAEALALVGTRRLDRAIAKAFFDDPARLQRDVLGDAVRERLPGLELPPLE